MASRDSIDYFFGGTYNLKTVKETRTFQRQAAAIWSEDERHDFIDWIANNPDAGVVIPGADGARKVRWSRSGAGKRAGVRIIYFHEVENELVLLVMIYAKAVQTNATIKDIKRG